MVFSWDLKEYQKIRDLISTEEIMRTNEAPH